MLEHTIRTKISRLRRPKRRRVDVHDLPQRKHQNPNPKPEGESEKTLIVHEAGVEVNSTLWEGSTTMLTSLGVRTFPPRLALTLVVLWRAIVE